MGRRSFLEEDAEKDEQEIASADPLAPETSESPSAE
jgi:hypothetical protein